MRALRQLLIVIALNVALGQDADHTSLCPLFKNNTRLQMPGSCNQYILCKDGTGHIFNCGANEKYDGKEQKCVTELNRSETCGNRCLNSNGKTFVAKPTDCRAYYYCENGEATESYCSNETFFDEDEQMCVYPGNSKCIKNVNNICEHVPDKTVFRDETDCSKYYKCEKNKLTKVDCKKQYFSVQTGRCAEKSTVTCTAHHATADTCLQKKKPFVGLKPDGATCRGFYICEYKGAHAHDIEPVWYQCPAGTFFDQTAQQCFPAVDVNCDYNRCDGRGNSTVTSSKNNCRNNLQCKNDRIVKEATCGNNYFFDERVGACVPYIVYDKCCDDEKTHS